MQNIAKIIYIPVFLSIFFIYSIYPVLAANKLAVKSGIENFNDSIKTTAGKDGAGYLDTNSPDFGKSTIVFSIETIVNVVLSVVGTLFFLFLIYAGFLWMNSRGNETEVKKALSIIQQSLIGLAIILLAYAITRFII
jgi:hypothetical protein